MKLCEREKERELDIIDKYFLTLTKKIDLTNIVNAPHQLIS